MPKRLPDFAAALVAAAVVLPTLAAPAAAQSALGNWTLADMPSGCVSPPEGSLTVERDGFLVGETYCRFARTAPAEFRGLKGVVQCESEGYPIGGVPVSMRMDGAALRLSLDGGPANRYVRCPGGGAPNDAEAAAAAALLMLRIIEIAADN
jgi:hypothetical protein